MSKGNEIADTCAGFAVREDEAKQYSATVWIREALEYVLIDKTKGEPIMGNARKYMKQAQSGRRFAQWQDEEKYRVQGRFARVWAKIEGKWNKEREREVLASRKLTKAINSIMLCQDEWGGQEIEKMQKKWICKVCDDQVGCAAHKLTCAGVRKICMAILRGRWAGRKEFQGVGRQAPKWVTAKTRKLRDGAVWYEMAEGMWVPSEVLETLAWGYEKTQPDKRIAKNG